MRREQSTNFLPGLALILSCLNLCGQAVSQEVDRDSGPLPLVGYNEHRTILPGGRHAKVRTNRAAFQILVRCEWPE